jgi:hypothetical protein
LGGGDKVVSTEASIVGLVPLLKRPQRAAVPYNEAERN